MTEENLAAVRQVRVEADKLRLECIKAGKHSSLMHIAFDQEIVDELPVDQLIMLGRLNKIQ